MIHENKSKSASSSAAFSWIYFIKSSVPRLSSLDSCFFGGSGCLATGVTFEALGAGTGIVLGAGVGLEVGTGLTPALSGVLGLDGVGFGFELVDVIGLEAGVGFGLGLVGTVGLEDGVGLGLVGEVGLTVGIGLGLVGILGLEG